MKKWFAYYVISRFCQQSLIRVTTAKQATKWAETDCRNLFWYSPPWVFPKPTHGGDLEFFFLQLAYRVSSYVTRILYWLEFSEDHLVWLKKNTRRTLFMLSLFGVENFYMQCCFLRWIWDIFEMALGPGICSVTYFLSFSQKNLSPEKTETN